jgi:hypothetical protein
VHRLLAGLAVVAIAVVARAQPILHVGARTRIDLTSIQRVPGGIVVRGALIDTALERPIPGRTVAISVDGERGFFRYAEPTSTEGTFRWRVPLANGQYTLRLAAGGDDDYAPAPVVLRLIDVARRTPIVEIMVPERASAADPRLRVTIAARDPEGDLDAPLGVSTPADELHPLDLPIALSLDGKHVASLATVSGRVEYDLPMIHLGPPGSTRTLTVRFAGDSLHDAAQASRTVLITTPTTVTLEPEKSELPWSGSVTLGGRLSDASGPIAGAPVTLWLNGAGERELARASTRGDGTFKLILRGGSAPVGTAFVEARYTPSQSWRDPARSIAVAITALAPEPLSTVFYVSPAITLLVIGLFALGRRRPWRALAAALRRVRARNERARSPNTGLAESRPRLLSSLRPPTDHGLAGQVLDASFGGSIPTATVVVHAGGVARACAVDVYGRFAFDALPAGPISIEVSAPGYVAEKIARLIPHRGELRGARVMLVPIRARMFATYLQATLPLLPNPKDADTWTPRELLRHVERRALLVEELAQLTALVEETYFGPRTPELSQLVEAERLAARVVARRPTQPGRRH